MSGLWRKATEQVSAISDGQESLRQSPELVARDVLEAWGSVWRAQHVHRGQEDRVPQDALDDIPLSPITLLHVRLALSSSSRDGKRVDGWTNKAMKSLRNASLAIVIRLLGQFEALRRLPLGSYVCLECYWRTVLGRSRSPPAQQIMNSAELLQILGEEVALRNSKPRQPRNGSRDRRENKKSMALATDAHARRHLELSRRTEGTSISNSACDLGVDSACVGRRRTMELTKRTAAAEKAAVRGSSRARQTPRPGPSAKER